MLIEGKNAVLEAVKANRVSKLLVQKGVNHEIIAHARKKGVKIQFVDKEVLDKKVDAKHQGFVAEICDFQYSSLEEILENPKDKSKFIVILDRVEDPHNLGSILRVCDCGGVDGVIIPKNRAVNVNDTVLRTSAGAASHVKVAKVTNVNSAIETLQKNGVWVYASDMDGKSVYQADLTGDIDLVVGGEGKGVSPLTKSKCDHVVSVPQKGEVNSLNASVACGIMVYEVVRQRGVK